jgi:hypothetical protein
MDTPTPPAPELTADALARAVTAAHLADMLQRYTLHYECGDHQFTPWPQDPDAGALRIVLTLQKILPYLPAEALERVETALRPDQTRVSTRAVQQ